MTPTQSYTYDALYRLIQAQGRELKGTADFGKEDNWTDKDWQTTYKSDGGAVQNYSQYYTYDAVGNILQLQHVAAVGSYTRDYTYFAGNNRLYEAAVGGDVYGYNYDNRGNMLEMPHLNVMDWNASNELYRLNIGSISSHYQYSGGQRIRKFVDKGSLKEERIYLGDFEIYRKFDSGGTLLVKRTTIHISDDSGRIAMQERRTYGTAADDNDTAEFLTRYIYSNHLQSASLELDDKGEVISYEEYHPYGTTSYQAMNETVQACAKRYRYTGKERDEESGLYYHGARYYIPWLCRWTACDPKQDEMPTWSSYNYGFCNPIIFNDPSGETPQGGWYTDNKGKYHFVDGINSKEQFEKSEYKDKGTWRGENVNEETRDMKYHIFYAMDGSRTFTDNETGEKKHFAFDGKETILKKGKSKESEKKEDNSSVNEGTAAASATTLYNSHQRSQYKAAITKLSEEKVKAVQDARNTNNVEAAETAAKEAHAGRNQVRLNTQRKLTPVGEEFSKAIEKDRSWETVLENKSTKSKTIFDTYEKIATSAGKSRIYKLFNIKLDLNTGVRTLGIIGLTWGIASSINEIRKAPIGQRSTVARNEIAGFVGNILGGIAGSTLGLAGLGFVGGLLAVTPVGWIAFGVAFTGSLIGGHIFGKTLQHIFR